ncbi:MAG: DEAD/DEAH box helicase [Rhodoferax sp.]
MRQAPVADRPEAASFDTLGLVEPLVRATHALGWRTPTPIQQQAIGAIADGHDVLGSAQTGSGKTAAYGLALLQRLQAQPPRTPRRVRALVLLPTRELAAQVGEVLRRLGQYLAAPLKTAVVFGGVSINPQMMGLRGGADIVVATPGRLLDLLDHNALGLAQLEVLVLDEADRLLELGFAAELERILALLPAQRQSLFFSATFDNAVDALAHRLLRAPLRIAAPATPSAAAPIVQRAIEVDAAQRTPLLRHLIAQHGWSRVLVFVATKYACERVAEKLYKAGIFATPFHGDLSQGARAQVLDEFKDERWEVVVTTDLAARGLDIAQLPVVVNYDLPRSPTDYVHRIGLTGRAGHSGLALSFVTAASAAHFALIERRQQLSLPREQIAGFVPRETAPAASADGAPAGSGGIKGKRPSKKDKLRAAAQMAGASGAALRPPR